MLCITLGEDYLTQCEIFSVQLPPCFQGFALFYNNNPNMLGVESTRAPSNPRKLIATSLVTRTFRSALVPAAMFAIRPQPDRRGHPAYRSRSAAFRASDPCR